MFLLITQKKVKWEIRLPGKCKQRTISGDWLPWRCVVAVAEPFWSEFAGIFITTSAEKEEKSKHWLSNRPLMAKVLPANNKSHQTVKRPAPAAVIKFRSFKIYFRWKTNKSLRHQGNIDKIIPPRFTSETGKSLFAAIADPHSRLGVALYEEVEEICESIYPRLNFSLRSRLANRIRSLWKSLKFSWWSFSITLSRK